MPADKLDLSGVPCPANAARALLRLEALDAGGELEITVDEGEPAAGLEASLAAEGHTVSARRRAGRQWIILARRSS